MEKQKELKKIKRLIEETRRDILKVYYYLGQIDGLIRRKRFLDKLKYDF